MRSLIRSIVREEFTERPYGIAYTGAIVENEHDIRKLRSVAWDFINMSNLNVSGWKEPDNYHMTICLGELPLGMKMRGDINSEVTLHVTHFGMSNDAVAFKVTGFMSKNDVQHITMLFRNKPADSKEMLNWRQLDEPFDVTAVIREVPAERP